MAVELKAVELKAASSRPRPPARSPPKRRLPGPDYPHTGMTPSVLVNGAPGMVVILGGQPVAVAGLTVARGKIVEIDIIADPERLRRFDLASLI